MNNKDWAFLIVFVLTAIVLIIPWDLEFADRSWGHVYNVSLAIGLASPIVYGTWRFAIRLSKPKLAFPLTLVIGCLMGAFLVYASTFMQPPLRNRYMLLYTDPDDANETIEIVHNHIFTHSWNEIKQINNYPMLGMSIRCDFEQDDLNGVWIVNEGNPFCGSIGHVRFINGMAEKDALETSNGDLLK